jgi:hypothetical protein
MRLFILVAFGTLHQIRLGHFQDHRSSGAVFCLRPAMLLHSHIGASFNQINFLHFLQRYEINFTFCLPFFPLATPLICLP